MVGSNLVVSFGLSAGGASNSLYILDTTTNSWVTSYSPNNLPLTSTRPQDWPGYTPPPPITSPGHNGTDPDHPDQPSSTSSKAGPIIGGIVGVAAIAALTVVALKRHRRNRRRSTMMMMGGGRSAAKVVGFYGPSTGTNSAGYNGSSQEDVNDPYRHSGMAFTPGAGGSPSSGSRPSSIGSRMEQLWMSSFGGLLGRKDKDRSQSQRLRDALDENEDDESDRSSWKGLQMGPAISDQDIFLDAVHRARSRTGMSPVFAPLQRPITSNSPPLSPRSPRMSSGIAYIPPPGQDSGAGVAMSPETECDEEGGVGGSGGPHGRAYSDGFENAMLEMDVQMLAVPRGRLFVVNPTNDEP